MARNRYIKTNSNYVLKGMHQSTNAGSIYERNWMTIDSLNSYSPGSTFYSGSEGFKMLPSNTLDTKKRHQFGFWLKNENSEYWSASNINNDNNTSTNNNESLFKPDYSSILDFAYYGSATKMIESSLSYIINKFPGEIYLQDEFEIIDGVRRYRVDNPFNIDFEKSYLVEDSEVNILRFFSKSYNNYVFYTKSGLGVPVTWSKNITNVQKCNPDGSLLSIIDLGTISGSDNHLLLYYYNYKGQKTLFHDGSFSGGYIRPNTTCINEFFNSLDIFQSKLLDKKTNYTITIKTPEENEKGYFEINRQYTWPKTGIGDWNLDISSETYETYVTELLKIGEFYDRHFTDNLWRSMTHESIINMDETLLKVDSEDLQYEQGNKMKKFLHITGRMFDDIKRNIDGVSYSNSVTYNEAKNKSDNFLSEDLKTCGWDIKLPIFSNGNFKTKPLYPAHVDGYDTTTANNEFYRRLLLNTNAILSSKGTKRCIEMVMSLFGYRSLSFVEHSFHEVERNGKVKMVTWNELLPEEKKDIMRNVYDITEYVYVANDDSFGFNQLAVSSIKSANGLKLTYDSLNDDEYQGIPVKEVIFTQERDILGTTIKGDAISIGSEIIEKNYLIPWFDKKKEYDGDLYFESKGGWGLSASKTTYIEGYGDKYYETGDDLKVYDESVKCLKFKENINELLTIIGEPLNTNDIYYVYDISGAEKYDWGLLGDEAQPTLSHYFILKDVSYWRTLGVLRDKDGKVMIEEGSGIPFSDTDISSFDELETTNDPYDSDTPEEDPSYPNIKWDVLPNKLYGWKNISEEELQENVTKDSQRVFYLEGVIDNNVGNNPHSGQGHYDDGETYKKAFEDVFKAAREDYEYDEVDDEELGDFLFEGTFKLFNLNKQIDNIKCWYFSDLTEKNNLKRLIPIEGGKFIEGGVETSVVGETDSFVRHYYNKEEVDIYNNVSEFDRLFSTKSYPIMTPVNPEGGSTDDEAAANSIVNTKSLFIEFMPDYKTAKSMYEFIEDIVMHYVKQVVPSTTLLRYKIPMTGLESFCYKKTYSQSALL